MEVRFCTDFDCNNGIVPANSPIYASTVPNYGQPSDYSLLDIVYIVNGADMVLGIVMAKHYGKDNICYVVLSTSAHNAGIPSPYQIGLYLQTLNGLLGQGPL